jgi:lipopolysaccharide assembly outer membrane protein LptD (OstA)
MVLHADAVDYDEKTQEIDAHGDVRIEPYRNRPPNTVVPH